MCIESQTPPRAPSTGDQNIINYALLYYDIPSAIHPEHQLKPATTKESNNKDNYNIVTCMYVVCKSTADNSLTGILPQQSGTKVIDRYLLIYNVVLKIYTTFICEAPSIEVNCLLGVVCATCNQPTVEVRQLLRNVLGVVCIPSSMHDRRPNSRVTRPPLIDN